MDWTGFAEVLGYLLGILVVTVVAGIYFAPVRFIIKLVLNSLVGGGALFIINKMFSHWGFFVGINPATCLVTGLLGVPGIVLLVILKLIF